MPLVREELDQALARAREVELEARLVADAFEAFVADSLDGRLKGSLAERGERGDVRGEESLRVESPEPRDEHGVVVVLELLSAEVPKVADPAVVDRPGIGVARLVVGRGLVVGRRGEACLALDCRKQPLLDRRRTR